MDPVVHFEMPYDDPARLMKFYQAAFGWKTKDLGEKMGHYLTASTGPTSPDGMMKKPGVINGASGIGRSGTRGSKRPKARVATRLPTSSEASRAVSGARCQRHSMSLSTDV